MLAASVDKTKLRRRLISAVLLGRNVLVKPGSVLGGDFRHIPACRPATRFGCVVAFSTYESTPPANSLFGRSGKGTRVLCTNPAGLAKGAALLDTIQPVAPFAPSVIGSLVPSIGLKAPKTKAAWFELRGAYSGRCSSAGGANVLHVPPRGGATTLSALPDATWGLHLADANIALGNLVRLVDRQARAYLKAHPG